MRIGIEAVRNSPHADLKCFVASVVGLSEPPAVAGHEVHTVEDAGLKGLENGELVKAAAGAYEVLVTVDQNIPYQQDLGSLPFTII